MQEASNADPGVAVADEPFNATERLQQEPQWHGWKFHVEIIEHRYQLVARIHGVDDQRHFRFEALEKSPHARAQRIDADARAVRRRMIVDELMAVELVVDASERRLHERCRAFAAEDGHEQIRRPVVRLAAVQIGEIVVEGNRRGNDALFAFGVQRVEVVDKPIADRAVVGDASGDDGKMPGVRLIVVALPPIYDEGQHRAAAPVRHR